MRLSAASQTPIQPLLGGFCHCWIDWDPDIWPSLRGNFVPREKNQGRDWNLFMFPFGYLGVNCFHGQSVKRSLLTREEKINKSACITSHLFIIYE